MAVAVVLGGRRVIIGQAATSAVLVATISVPTLFDFTRSVDALVGGAAALASTSSSSPSIRAGSCAAASVRCSPTPPR